MTMSPPKTHRQPQAAVMYPPSVGAMMGETAITSIKLENILAFSSTANKSLTMAREATIPTQPPNACNNRMTMS